MPIDIVRHGAHNDPMNSTYQIGDRVLITSGRYEGKRGTVWHATAKLVAVDFDTPLHGDNSAQVRTSSVRSEA